MVKIHTRQKRKLRMRHGLGGRNRAVRPKTFKTEEEAKKYAAEQKITTFKLVDMKASNPNENKIKIISE